MPSMHTRIHPSTPGAITRAAGLLRSGGLVAFPTETVYGLGADATNDRAVASIYSAKGRPQFNPLITHVHEATALDPFIEWSESARLLAAQFWPGPLTLVLPRRNNCPVSLLVSAGLDTLAVRVPDHAVALALLRETGRPVAAPSANASGKLSPTTPLHVLESLGDAVDMILSGGACRVGVESTVINLCPPRPIVLRPGGITRDALERLLGPVDVADTPLADNAGQGAPYLSPGMMESHYAPTLPLRMNAVSAASTEALLCFGPDAFVRGGTLRLNLSAHGDLEEAAANLFSMLHKLDQPGLSGIAVMSIPDIGLGSAINDRLRRASGSRVT